MFFFYVFFFYCEGTLSFYIYLQNLKSPKLEIGGFHWTANAVKYIKTFYHGAAVFFENVISMHLSRCLCSDK